MKNRLWAVPWTSCMCRVWKPGSVTWWPTGNPSCDRAWSLVNRNRGISPIKTGGNPDSVTQAEEEWETETGVFTIRTGDLKECLSESNTATSDNLELGRSSWKNDYYQNWQTVSTHFWLIHNNCSCVMFFYTCVFSLMSRDGAQQGLRGIIWLKSGDV